MLFNLCFGNKYFLYIVAIFQNTFIPTKSNFWMGGELTGEQAERERAKRITQQ